MPDTRIIEVCVRNELGMHARPAAMLAKEAQKFVSDVFLVLDGREVDAKSVLDILTLAAARGSHMQIKATGQDAEAALLSLERVFKQGFGEG